MVAANPPSPSNSWHQEPSHRPPGVPQRSLDRLGQWMRAFRRRRIFGFHAPPRAHPRTNWPAQYQQQFAFKGRIAAKVSPLGGFCAISSFPGGWCFDDMFWICCGQDGCIALRNVKWGSQGNENTLVLCTKDWVSFRMPWYGLIQHGFDQWLQKDSRVCGIVCWPFGASRRLAAEENRLTHNRFERHANVHRKASEKMMF